ncbi:MAG: helix-turn-helix transcriptional regulator [Lachnospiraceae bacterium]|jgi:plasmid maintenance system antidote protein VapI|nr:helix-turn-helix transcriptional regulator [Lachnospiraceae bacterium]
MTLQTYLDSKNITKYHLSKISGVPKTTILDICAGRSSLERCSARTVRQLAKALDCSMEDIMAMAEEQPETETPETEESEDDSYLECGLPPFLQESVEAMAAAWQKLDAGEEYLRWDCDYCSLQSDINNAEVNQLISSEQAWYLREKYLGMERV